jgi:poly(3-hydroxybutyrate) depolymerase
MFAGVFAHSSLACGSASGAAAAFSVMSDGADTDVQAIGAEARKAAPNGSVRLPLLAIHGDDDEVVATVNAFQTVRQYLALNGRAAIDGAPDMRPTPDDESIVVLADGRKMKVAEYRDRRRVVARLLQIPKLGHAWAGGDATTYAYNDPRPPDATALLAEFIEGRLRP